MKKYINPEFEAIKNFKNDIITTSLGTETPKYEESDGVWNLDIEI